MVFQPFGFYHFKLPFLKVYFHLPFRIWLILLAVKELLKQVLKVMKTHAYIGMNGFLFFYSIKVFNVKVNFCI